MNCDCFRTGWASSSRSLMVEAQTENSALLRNPPIAVLSWWTNTSDKTRAWEIHVQLLPQTRLWTWIRHCLTHSGFEDVWEILVPQSATFDLSRIVCCWPGGQTGHRWCASYAGLASGPGAACGDYWGTGGSRFCCQWWTCTRCACCSGSGCMSDEHQGKQFVGTESDQERQTFDFRVRTYSLFTSLRQNDNNSALPLATSAAHSLHEAGGVLLCVEANNEVDLADIQPLFSHTGRHQRVEASLTKSVYYLKHKNTKENRWEILKQRLFRESTNQ